MAAGLLLVLGCSSPEADRVRGGGPGADPGNVGRVVEMHGGSKPFHATPCLGEAGIACAEQTTTSSVASRSGSE